MVASLNVPTFLGECLKVNNLSPDEGQHEIWCVEVETTDECYLKFGQRSRRVWSVHHNCEWHQCLQLWGYFTRWYCCTGRTHCADCSPPIAVPTSCRFEKLRQASTCTGFRSQLHRMLPHMEINCVPGMDTYVWCVAETQSPGFLQCTSTAMQDAKRFGSELIAWETWNLSGEDLYSREFLQTTNQKTVRIEWSEDVQRWCRTCLTLCHYSTPVCRPSNWCSGHPTLLCACCILFQQQHTASTQLWSVSQKTWHT